MTRLARRPAVHAAPTDADPVARRANDTARPYPADASLPELFHETAAARPRDAALLFDGGSLSYGELTARSDALARRLRRRGVGAETAVGLAVERSPQMVVALLAILRAGGFYVPLDPAYPQDRLTFMVEDAGVDLLLTAGAAPPALAAAAPRLVDLAELEAEPSPDAAPPPPPPRAEQLAYVMYTSGSTGRPKGVAVTHRNVVRLVRGSDFAAFGPQETWLQFAPVSFDASTLEIWGPLLNGGRLALQPPGAATPAELVAAVERFGVTGLWLTAGLFHQVVESELEGLGSLRWLLAGGDVLSAAHVGRVLDAHPATAMVNGYGPTENTTFTTTHRAGRDDGDGPVPIGRPVANTTVHLLDAGLRPVEAGDEGELCAGGDGVSRGYLGRPALTAARFLPDPFGPPGSRLYRTGDLARWRRDGGLEFLGRIDHQVKIRGFRVEPGEVEVALTALGAVAAAAVVVRTAPAGDKRLVAYVAPAAGREPTASELRRRLGERLPEHMVPARFVFLDELPLNPNGKVDRRALPAPGGERPELSTPYRAPETAAERRLAVLWGELLGIERVGADDDFIELGGHSLLAVRLASRLRQEGLDVTLSDLFAHPTVAALALHLQIGCAAADGGLPPLEPVDRGGDLPLAFPQEQVWFHQQLAPDSLAYNTQFTVELRGELDPDVLQRALGEIVRRHEALRTTFHRSGEEGVQRVHPPWPVDLALLDVSERPPDEVREALERAVRETVSEPFDVAGLPLVRWRLVRTAADAHHLIHVEHHFIHDGWSVGVFLRELETLYAAFAAGRPSPLAELPVQFGDFAAWQRSYLQGDLLQRKVDFFAETLGDYPTVLELPTDRPRPHEQSFRGARLDAHLPERLYADLRVFSRRRGVTLFVTMLAAFEVLLSRFTGAERFLVGSAVANRQPREVEALIGMVVNTVVLPADVGGDPTFAELVGWLKRRVVRSWQHQDLPVDKLVARLQPERDLSRNPLFQVMFSFHDSPIPDLDFAGVRGRVDVRQNASSKADFNVIFQPRAEQRVGREARREDREMQVHWEYATDLFDASTVERLWRAYGALLQQIVADPDVRLSELDVWAPEDRRRVLVAWNDTGRAYGRHRPLPQRCAERAAAAPGAPAVVTADGRTVSYGELADRARRLAAELVRRGVGREDRVAVCASRSPQTVAALLGILGTGAAYVPVDPRYPAQRVLRMVEDSGAAALLTDAAVAGGLPAVAVPVIDVGGELPAAGGLRPAEVAPEQIAYVIYTSGSTGRPKGVAVSHGGLANLVDWHLATYGVGSADRCPHLAGPAFDASVWEIWPVLAAGACLHLPDEETRATPEKLRDWLLQRRITHAFVPTPMAERLLPLEWPAGTGLRVMLTGGDALHRHPRPELPFALVNHYGPTENSVVATAGTVTPRREGDGPAARPHVGGPISNVRCLVLDRRLRPVPPRVPGELYLGGDGLARGYLGRPGLTAAAFLPDPFATEGGKAGGRLYRTGDRVRWVDRGGGDGPVLEFLGRVDSQVQVRGFRIEPGEIEAVMSGVDGVGQAAVLAFDVAGEPGEKRLVGYWQPAAGGDGPGDDELRRALERQVPDYMVPTALVRLDELPLTANGKLDRNALPRPDLAASDGDFVAPRTPLEELMAEVWEDLLKAERVGARDHFFRLGGHSLAATRLVSRLRDLLDVEAPLALVFDNPVLENLARRVEELVLEETAGPA